MGLFGNKAAPTSAAPRAKAAQKPQPVAITGLGLACHAGDQPYELISSILGQISGVELGDEYKFMSNEGSYLVPRLAPVKSLEDATDRDRMYSLSATALGNATAQLSSNVGSASILVVVMVRPELITRFKKIDTDHFVSYLKDQFSRLEGATFRILPTSSTSSTSALHNASAELNEKKWQAVIFGAADSLISIFTCQDLHRDERLNVVGNTEGVVPGEGAAFVMLQIVDAAEVNATPVLGYLRGLGVAAEPNARDADIEATEGLSSAINQAIVNAGIDVADIQGIVHGLGAETVQAIEWYQTSKKTWPRRVNEQQRVAVQLGEVEQADTPNDPIPTIILPHMTMGEVGAAALPMRLATAVAWMEYDARQARWGFPVRKHLLVCDTPETPERGALIISATLAAVT
jgi:3-oxoacyl-[acyl-carrier-protein] synthase-1